MNYIISKSGGRSEYRIYKDGDDFEGYPIYNGHKLGVENNLLAEVLDYRIDRGTGKIHFLKYDKVVTEPNHLDLKMWEIGRGESMQKNLLDSWISLNQVMREKLGEYRKIIITKVNI